MYVVLKLNHTAKSTSGRGAKDDMGVGMVGEQRCKCISN